MSLELILPVIMLAIALQTALLTPSFGFALFYLPRTAPAALASSDIYRGVLVTSLFGY